MRAAAATEGWGLLVADMQARREKDTERLYMTTTTSEDRERIVWRQQGRDDVLNWFNKQINGGTHRG